MALLQITTIPLGTGSTSVSSFVAQIHQKLTEEKASFKLGDMSTIIEGDIDELLRIVRAIYDIPFEAGATRVVTQISIDDRRDKVVALGDKTKTVQSLLNNTQ
jgi:uncharacterized protein (TIGR00106 family)